MLKKGGWNIRKSFQQQLNAIYSLQSNRMEDSLARRCIVFLLWILVALHRINRSHIYSSHPNLHQLHVTLTPPLYLLHWHRCMSHRLQGVKTPRDQDASCPESQKCRFSAAAFEHLYGRLVHRMGNLWTRCMSKHLLHGTLDTSAIGHSQLHHRPEKPCTQGPHTIVTPS